MTSDETRILTESLIPIVIGGSIGVLALVGIRELLREAKTALKRSVNA